MHTGHGRRNAAGLVLVLGVGAAHTAAALSWADLWSRPDQRAQTLLEMGKPAAAAPLFDDPAQRAYAEMQAHDYATAAKQLAGLKDPESAYNRGNALAHSNQLSDALAAYDSALALAPPNSALHRDAQHNRDLVAKQLDAQGGDKKQPAQNGKGGDKPGDQHDQAKDQAQGAQSKDAQKPPAETRDQQKKDASQQGQSAQGQDAKTQPENGQGEKTPEPGQTPQRQSGQDQASSAQNGGTGAPPEPPKDSAAKVAADAKMAADAKRDAEQRAAANAAAAKLGQGPDAKDPKGAARVDDGKEHAKPETEQAMALDQWLRWIPDDPSGLLRRKFMIEHMEKQREQAQ